MQPKQVFSVFVSLKVSCDKDKLTEAAVRRWVKKRFKDCELGEILVGDVVEHSQHMIEEAQKRLEQNNG